MMAAMRRSLVIAFISALLATSPAYAEEAETTFTLSKDQRDALIQAMREQKPNPGYFAMASALLPGAGQLALGEWREPAIVWGLLLGASMGVYALKTNTVGVHPAFLGSTPLVVTTQVRISEKDNPSDITNRFLLIAYLAAAGWTGWRTYSLALERRAEIDTLIAPLEH